MTSWERTMDLYLDVAKFATGANPLLNVDGGSVRSGGSPTLIQGDHLTLRLHFCRFTSAGLEIVDLPAGSAIVFAGRLRDEIESGDILFAADTFTVSGTGDDLLYYADLDLNTTELDEAIGSEAQLIVRCDVEVQNADNSRRMTLQFDATVRHEVYAEGAAVPVTVAVDRAYRIADGELQLWNPDQSLWHSIYVRGGAGAEQLVIGAGEA
jgi:hypothetical protein